MMDITKQLVLLLTVILVLTACGTTSDIEKSLGKKYGEDFEYVGGSQSSDGTGRLYFKPSDGGETFGVLTKDGEVVSEKYLAAQIIRSIEREVSDIFSRKGIDVELRAQFTTNTDSTWEDFVESRGGTEGVSLSEYVRYFKVEWLSFDAIAKDSSSLTERGFKDALSDVYQYADNMTSQFYVTVLKSADYDELASIFSETSHNSWEAAYEEVTEFQSVIDEKGSAIAYGRTSKYVDDSPLYPSLK
jgi:hypothetical protein